MVRQLLRCSGKGSKHIGELATVPAMSTEDEIHYFVSLTTLVELD